MLSRCLVIVCVVMVFFVSVVSADAPVEKPKSKLTMQLVDLKVVSKNGKKISNISDIENFSTSHQADSYQTPSSPIVFYVSRKCDVLSPHLMEAVLKKKRLKKVVIKLEAEGFTTAYQLQDVLLFSYSASGYNAPDGLVEQLSMQSSNIKIIYDGKDVKSEAELKL